MCPDSIRFALATVVTSLCEATALATGKPVGELSGHFMREIAKNADAETVDVCGFLADCAYRPEQQPTGRMLRVIDGGRSRSPSVGWATSELGGHAA
jgi:hypothetical protein